MEKDRKPMIAPANNYILEDYFSSKITDMRIDISIDLIRMSAILPVFGHIDTELQKHFKSIADNRPSISNFNRRRRYADRNKEFEIFYDPKTSTFIPSSLAFICIHQPDTDLMYRLNSVLSSMCVKPKLNKVEFAYDFFSPYPYDVLDYLKRHIFLKYQRSKSKKFKTTYYTNNIRNSSKGIRIYPRPKIADHIDCIRLEFEIHRPIIKELGLSFPLDLRYVTLDFGKYFDFRRIDFEKLYKFLAKKERHRVAIMNNRCKDTGQLILRHTESWVRSLTDIPLMEAIEQLKRKNFAIPNYSRFLEPIDSINRLIEEATKRQRFVLPVDS